MRLADTHLRGGSVYRLGVAAAEKGEERVPRAGADAEALSDAPSAHTGLQPKPRRSFAELLSKTLANLQRDFALDREQAIEAFAGRVHYSLAQAITRDATVSSDKQSSSDKQFTVVPPRPQEAEILRLQRDFGLTRDQALHFIRSLKSSGAQTPGAPPAITSKTLRSPADAFAILSDLEETPSGGGSTHAEGAKVCSLAQTFLEWRKVVRCQAAAKRKLGLTTAAMA